MAQIQLPAQQVVPIPPALGPENSGYQSDMQMKLSKQIRVFSPQGNESTGKQDAGIEYSTIEYPVSGLGGDQYPHYTIFHINDYEKSVAKSGESTVDVALNQRTAGSSMSKSLTTKTSDTSALQKTIDDASADTALSKFSKGIGDVVVDSADYLKGALAKFSATKKRLKLSICLPMPVHIVANYGATYGQTDAIGAVGGVILAALSGEGSDALATAKFGMAPAIATMGAELAKGVLGSSLGDSLVGDSKSIASKTEQLVSKLSGTVLNKRQEQLFHNMEFRSHTFTYLFIPRNKEESENIKNIIHSFKLYMHPELNEGKGSSMLITPAEFDIEFRFKYEENKSVHRIATCALAGMDVDYTSIGEFIAFKNTDNPVAISLTLRFVEMEPINRSMIRQYGF